MVLSEIEGSGINVIWKYTSIPVILSTVDSRHPAKSGLITFRHGEAGRNADP
jgi:hypothetical protein